MNKFKHSGAFGDLIYSLPIVKHLGGGEFYLHLNQINWIGQHYYGSAPNPVHQGRLNQRDYDFMKTFMESQTYITEFGIMSSDTEITHNLDRFRPPFVGHPGNYVDIYSVVFGVMDLETRTQLRNTPWLTVPSPRKLQNRTTIINRTARWIPRQLSTKWRTWQAEGLEDVSTFVGLPDEYENFKRATGWNIPYQETASMLELAEYIAGADQFIGNQSVALSLALGLGVNTVCEARDDLPLERNECYFVNKKGVEYF